MIAAILLALGLLLIFIEFFLPGGILGIIGGFFILAGVIVFGYQTQSLLYFLLFLILAAVLLFIIIRFALWRIRSGKTFYLHGDQEGYVASSFAKEYIGRSGLALSDLKPSGHILIDGKQFQAVSKSGYIDKDSKITVIGGEGGHLIVKINAKEEMS